MAETRFGQVNEDDVDRIINAAVPKNTESANQYGMSVFNGE